MVTMWSVKYRPNPGFSWIARIWSGVRGVAVTVRGIVVGMG
jgi:hypothetical protein